MTQLCAKSDTALIALQSSRQCGHRDLMDAAEEIKQRLNIEDVIGEYVELKRAGRNFRGLSPFTSEKTPSFMVSPEKQIWHDFSSGKGGNMFSFVMEMEGLDFKGALELLARKAGVDLSQYRSSNYARNAKTKERLYECLELATKFYQTQFKNNRAALEYILKKRAFSKQTALGFRIGYAPDGGEALARFLTGKGFTPTELKQAGLGNVFRGNLRDMFRGRIMIPLMDSSGRVVGFTARLLKDDPNAPKYINTPATMLYDKSRHVFGLHAAKEAIRKRDFAVVVEGNMDVIASHQANVRNVVATAGTAMTKPHLKEIGRFTHDIRLCFDQDKAGVSATERTIILANQMDIKLGVITIPAGKDPDELIRSDAKAWEDSLDNSEYALDWLIKKYAAEHSLTSGVGKKEFTAKIMPILDHISNSVEKEHYKRSVADMLGVTYEALDQQAKPASQKVLKKAKNQTVHDVANADILKSENQYMSLMFMQPSLRVYMALVEPYMFISNEAAELFKTIKAMPKEKAKDILEVHKNVQQVTDYGKIVTLLYEELYAHLEFVELEYEAARLQVRVIEHYVKDQKRAVVEKLQQEADETTVTKLLTKAKKLDQLLKQAKETTR